MIQSMLLNYNDLTATSLESWLVRGIIPKWPYFRFVNYYNLPRINVGMIFHCPVVVSRLFQLGFLFYRISGSQEARPSSSMSMRSRSSDEFTGASLKALSIVFCTLEVGAG